jgi:hypothetical protein
MPKKIQTNRDSAAALIESCVEISEQASDAGTFDDGGGANRERSQALLGLC